MLILYVLFAVVGFLILRWIRQIENRMMEKLNGKHEDGPPVKITNWFSGTKTNAEVNGVKIKNSPTNGHASKTALALNEEDLSDTESDDSCPPGTYEVEAVLDYQKDDKGAWYLIKWKGWDESFNTWEPIENLGSCELALLTFYNSRKAEYDAIMEKSEYVTMSNGRKRRRGPYLSFQLPPDPRPFETRSKEYLDKEGDTVTEEELSEFERKMNTKKEARWATDRIDRYIQDGLSGKLTDEKKVFLRRQILIVLLEKKKEKAKKDLKKWQEYLNRVSEGKPKIFVVNDVDSAGPPKDFKYVNDYIPTGDLIIPNEPPVGCECTDCYVNRKKCCPHACGTEFAYTMYRKVKIPIGRPIYECNQKCKCGPNCVNRVVQDGRNNLKFCIFRTSNGRGWGVKTLQVIKKGSFVTLYLGEIINTEEAERRGKTYDAEGCTYLFDLDFNETEDSPYTVDAKMFGNVSHFINHSCEPSLGVYAVWSDCLDPNLPKLALFALRDIPKGEELTFNYMSQHIEGRSVAASGENNNNKTDIVGLNSQNPNPKSIECKCGSENCRKILFG